MLNNWMAHRITIPSRENNPMYWILPCILFFGSPVEYPRKYIHLPARYITPAIDAERGYGNPAVNNKLKKLGRFSRQFWCPRCTQLNLKAASFVNPSPSEAYKSGYFTPYFFLAFTTPMEKTICCRQREYFLSVSLLRENNRDHVERNSPLMIWRTEYFYLQLSL